MEVARLTTVLDAVNAPLTRTLRDSAEAGKGFALAMVASLATVGAAAVKVGLVMDDALDTIRIRTGQTAGALNNLGDSFRDVFRAGPDGAQQAADALSTLRQRTGQSGDGLEALTSQVLTLSRITKTDLTSNVGDSARLFTSWGVAVSEQAGVLDMVFRTYQQTGVSVDALLGKLVTAGPVFRSAGFDIATSAALLGGFEQAGVSAERVVASMTAAWRFFGKEGINAQTGIRETIARIQELGPGAEAAALGVKVFGRGAVDMVAAIQSGRLNVDALVKSIKGGTDTIAAAARATDGFTENLAILRNRATLALEPFGTAILETFNRGLLAVLEPSRGLTDALHLMGKAAVVVASAMVGRMVPALALLARGYIASTAAVIANTVAMLRNATAAGVLAGAVGVLRGALAFFGGPWGLAVTAALTAVGIGFLNAGRRARQAAADARQAADDFRAAIAGMDEATFAATAAATRQMYGGMGRAFDRATALVRSQQGVVDALSRQAGVDRFGEQRLTPELRSAQSVLRQYEAQVERIRAGWVATASNVRAVQDQERALAGFRATTGGSTGGGPGPLDWEGSDKEGKTAVQLLAERVSLLTEVLEVQRTQGQAAASIGEELNRIYEESTERLRAMGDATRLPDAALEGYRELLGIVERLRATGVVGVEIRTVPQGTPFAPGGGFTSPFARAERTQTASGAQGDYWDVERQRQAERLRALSDEMTALQRLRAGVSRYGDAAKALAETGNRVRQQWASVLSVLPQQIGAFADAFTAVRDKRFAQVAAGGQATGLPPVPAAAGMMLAMEFLSGVAESLGPALEALLLPVRMLGETFGRALVPIARALFPTFRLVAIAASVVGEVFFRVAGAINVAVGGLVRGIGQIINLLPGSLGNPLIALGQTMINMGRGFQEGAEELARARDDLRGLTFDDALDRVNNGLNRMAESLSNVPPVFDLALRRMQAGRATAVAGTPAPSPAPPLPSTSGGGQGGQPVHVVIQPGAFVFQVDGRSAATDRELARMLEGHFERKLSSGVNPLTNAVKRAYEAR